MHNFIVFISHDCFIAPYGRYTGHRTVKHTEWCTDIPAAVPAGVRKMAHDDDPIMGGYSLQHHGLRICSFCKFTPIRRREFGSDFGLAGKNSVHASGMASPIVF
jgi:hypothetical protein